MDFLSHIRKGREADKEVLPFSDWFRAEVERSEHIKEAERILKEAEHLSPPLEMLGRTPQGCPEHGEGPTVKSHVLRSLTALSAIFNGANMRHIELYASNAQLAIDLDYIEHVLKEHYATLAVFVLIHDVQKTAHVRIRKIEKPSLQTAAFEAPRAKHAILTDHERDIYAKLYRATEAHMQDTRPEEVMLALYAKHGIRFDYKDHEKWFVNDESAASFTALFNHYRLTPRDIQQVKFLTRYHILAHELLHHRGKTVLQVLDRAAQEYGLDAGDARDIWLVAVFLNDVCGKIPCDNGAPGDHSELLTSFIIAEEEAFFEAREKKRAWKEQSHRARMKQSLEEAGLSIEKLIHICEIPHSKEREVFVRNVYELIAKKEGVTVQGVFGEHAGDIAEQIALAQVIFDESA